MDSLPDELVLEIVEHLAPNDKGIFSLSASNKRFHHLVLPMYLEAWIDLAGMSSSQDLALRPNQLDVLAGLQTSLFIHSMKHISCSFTLSSGRRDYSSRDMNRFLHHIRALTGFLSNLKTVDEVTLDFKELNFWVIRERIDVLETWESIISRLLDVIFKKCTTFNIQGGMFIVHASQFQRRIAPRETIERQSMLRRITSMFLTKTDPQQASSPSKFRVQTFNIHSRVLLLHPCYHWTMSALSASPIVSLSIMHVDIPQRSWDEILSKIHAPALEHLTMDLRCKMRPATLNGFFARHPRIRTLDLGRELLPLTEGDVVAKGCLLNLTELSATPTYVRFLMTDRCSPAVRSLRLLVKVSSDAIFDAAEINQILAPCSSRLKAPSLILTVAITVDYMSTHWTEFFPAQAGGKHGLLDSLQYAHILEFVSTCPSHSAADTLARLLPTFPLLEAASFTACLNQSLDFVSFLSNVKGICPELKVVTVDGRTHDVA